MFAHSVRSPLAVLRDHFKSSDPPKNLIDFVNGLKHRIYVAGELAREKLVTAQMKIKSIYDQTKWCQFSPGDQVLALLPMEACAVYLDDAVVYSDSWDSHVLHICFRIRTTDS